MEENKIQVEHDQSDDVYTELNKTDTESSDREEEAACKRNENEDCVDEKEPSDMTNQCRFKEDNRNMNCKENVVEDVHEQHRNREKRRQMDSTGNERYESDSKKEVQDTINYMASRNNTDIYTSNGPETGITSQKQRKETIDHEDNIAYEKGSERHNWDTEQEALPTISQPNAGAERANYENVKSSDRVWTDITAEKQQNELINAEKKNEAGASKANDDNFTAAKDTEIESTGCAVDIKSNERYESDSKKEVPDTISNMDSRNNRDIHTSTGPETYITSQKQQEETIDHEAEKKNEAGASKANDDNFTAAKDAEFESTGCAVDIKSNERYESDSKKEVPDTISNMDSRNNRDIHTSTGPETYITSQKQQEETIDHEARRKNEAGASKANDDNFTAAKDAEIESTGCAVKKKNEDGTSKVNGDNFNAAKDPEIGSTGCAGKYSKKPSNDQAEVSSDYSELPSEPSDLIEVDSSSSSISLAWRQPERGADNVENYEIKYRECNKRGAKWVSATTETSRRTIVMCDLKCGTEYEFKIRALTDEGEEGPFSQTSMKMSTRQSLAKVIQMDARQSRQGKDGNPSIFKLPLYQGRETTNYNAKTRKCIFGQRSRGNQQEKTIMLVGATGSGKSTLIDGMINYITGVSWDDDFRFSLVDLTEEEKKKHSQQAQSQTEWITCYTIHKMKGSKIDYDLNIIDTPGFGDTRGIIRDKAIIDQIREFFTTPGDQGITFLDAICFVTQAPLARLTPPQRYIFDAILSVFGQDVANNIFVLMTFADGNEPPVREALKVANVPFQKSFKFNNSALFANTIGKSDEAKFGNLFWKMGKESFRIFFDELTFVEARSLQLTTQVLQLRKNLEATIQGLQPQITEGINKLNTIRQEKEILQRHKTDIAANRNFIYEVDEIHMRKIDLQPRVYVTNCLTCNRTCHFPCGIPNDEKKSGCAAMKNGNCKVCPKNCHWTVHRNNTFRFETYPVKVKKTYDELKQKYEIAQAEEKRQKSVIGKVKSAFTSLGAKVSKMVYDVRCYINKLNEIALRPNPLSDIDYIDLLIDSEKNERKYGWETRLKLFYKLREEAVLVAKTSKLNYRPWGEASDILSDDD